MPAPQRQPSPAKPTPRAAPETQSANSPAAANPLWSSFAWRLQAKLSIGAQDDPLEREAEAVAESVMATPAGPPRFSAAPAPGAQRRCADCGARDTGDAAGAGAQQASALVSAAVNSAGEGLDAATRGRLEPRFGRDLGDVRLHTGTHADAAARAIGARAFTLGHHVAFAAGQFAPKTEPGMRLLSHELAHVVQQGGGQSGTVQRAPLPGFSQGSHDTCQPASMLTALIIRDRERASAADPNGNMVGICNAALIYLQQNRASLIAQWNAGGGGLAHFNNSVTQVTRIRDQLRPAGSTVTESQYQELAVVLSELGDSSDSIMRHLGLAESSSSSPRDSLDQILTDSLVTGLAPGEIDQIEWYVHTRAATTTGQTIPATGYHMFLIGRGQRGEWYLSDQGQNPPFETTAPDLPTLRQQLMSASASGRSWIVTNPQQHRIQLTWTGVHRVAAQDFTQPHVRLARPGTFLAEIDADWSWGERISTWDFVGIAYSQTAAVALFPGSGNGHGFLVGEMPAGVFNVWKTHPVSAANMAATGIDRAESNGGLLVRTPPVFLHAWLYLRTATTPASGARNISVY